MGLNLKKVTKRKVRQIDKKKERKRVQIEEFKKKKAKIGRKLNPPINETNTSFKSKKIIVLHNFKPEEDSDSDTGYTLTELLNRVNHYNPSNRADALRLIREKLLENKQSLIVHLSEIMGKVLRAMTDVEPSVRITAIRLLKHILERTNEHQMEAFSPLIISHLCCALTNVSTSVRYDSLKLLDTVLDTQPNNICHSDKVLINFLDQISFHAMCGKGKKEHISNRQLRVEPEQNIESHMWRLQVLKHLLKFLNVIVATLKKENRDEEDINEIKWESKPMFVPIYACGGLKPYNPFNQGYHMIPVNSCIHNKEVIKKFVSQLMPLLFETWKEATVRQSFNESSAATVIKQTDVMFTVVSIICAVGEWILLVNKNVRTGLNLVTWLQAQYSKAFCTKFMKSFPYFGHDVFWEKKRKKVPLEKVKVQLNLAICTFYSSFVMFSQHSTVIDLKAVEDYVLFVTERAIIEGVNAIPDVIRIIENFLTFNDKSVTTNCQLVSLQKLCKILHPSYENRNIIISFFSELVLDMKYRDLLEHDAIAEWLGTLIDEMKSMTESRIVDKKLLTVIKKIASRQYPSFMDNMQVQSGDLLSMLTSKEEVLQNTVADLITKLNEISPEFLQDLSYVIQNPLVTLRNVRYIVQHLCQRLITEKDGFMNYGAFLKFLFNLTTGVKLKEIDNWADYDDPIFSKSWETVAPLVSYVVTPSRIWKRQSKIVDIAIESLLWLPNKENVSVCTFYFLSQFLSVSPSMPIHCALGLLDLHRRVGCNKGFRCQDGDIALYILELSLSCVMYGTAVVSFESDESIREEYGVSSSISQVPYKRDVYEFLGLLRMKIPTCEVFPYELAERIGSVILNLLNNGFFAKNDFPRILPVLQEMQEVLGDYLMEEEWWLNVYGYFRTKN